MKEIIYEQSAEAATLSCICHAPTELQKEMVEKIKEDHFYLNEHKLIYRAALRLIAQNLQADWVTIMNELEAQQQLASVGGQQKIAEIATFCPSHTNWTRYYPKLEDARYRRSLEVLASDMIHKARDREMTLDQLKNWSETSVMKADFMLDDGDKLSIKSAADAAVSNIEAILRGEPRRGVSTGMKELDKILAFGLRGGDMAVLAARPSVGKSSAAMQIAEHVALDLKKRVLIFSLEMTSVSLMERMIRSRARVPVAHLLARAVTNDQKMALANATQEIIDSNILCDDSSGRSMGYIKAVSRRVHQKQPIDLIVIDYLQLIHGDSKRGKENRVCEVEEISNGVKELAKSLNVPILILAQLNRDPEKRKGKPNMADLKGSGAIEQDADIVIMIHRDDEDPENQTQMPYVEFVVAKHRDGATDSCKMLFNKPITRFQDIG
jgi:replicative DNA helicase